MRKKIVLFLCICICGIAISSVSAQTVSFYSVSSLGGAVTYDPYAGTDTTDSRTITFTVQLTNLPWWWWSWWGWGNSISYCVIIDGSPASSRNLSSSSGNLTVKFIDPDTDNEILSSQNYNSTSMYSGTFYAGESTTQSFTISFLLPKGQNASWNTYTGNFTLKLYQKSYPSGSVKDYETFTYSANVAQTIDVRVGSATGNYSSGSESYNIDLGEISQGASANFGIFVRGNTAYTLTMNAPSGGYLSSATTSDKVSYTLTIDGNSYTLGSNVMIDHQTSRTMYSKVFLGAINVPSGQEAGAGQYSDAISFSVTAN